MKAMRGHGHHQHGKGRREDGAGRAPERHAAVLSEIAAQISLLADKPLPQVSVSGIACEPDKVRPGDLYVALDGRLRGSIGRAVGRGAVAVVTEEGLSEDPGVPVMLVQDAVRALGHLADRLWGRPSRALRTCGVTGSFGKTSTAHLLQAALDAAGCPTARIGEGQGPQPGSHRLQRRLGQLLEEGARACVMEVSSRDLVLGRFEGVSFHCGVFTNLVPRHLDFHGSLREYLDAKAELFRQLESTSIALLNRDEPAWEVLAAETRARVVTFGVENGGDIRARICRMDREGCVFEVTTPVGTLPVTTRLVGRRHVYNVLAAFGAALALDVDPEAAARGLADAGSVPGRLERLPLPVPFDVLADVAPDACALDGALRSLRPIVNGRLVVVLGAPEGPPSQRPLWARTAERWADALVVTDGASAGENPMTVIGELARSLRRPRNALLEPNRAAAIRMVLDRAQPGDTVLLVSASGGRKERRVVRDWCLKDLEAEAARGTAADG